MSHLYIGIMSGTSMDGIDGVILDTSNGLKIVDHVQLNFPPILHNTLTSLIQHQTISLSELGCIEIQLAELYAEIVHKLLNNNKLSANQIKAIGCHGQTVYHQPEGNYRFSTQLGSGSYLAELTSITTVNDFRNRDMAAGGQGAPLVPGFHQACFKSHIKNRMVINIGGIANCTYLPVKGNVTGFDIGPGNTLLDNWINKSKGKSFDQSGQWAKTGKVIHPLLELMMNDPYFKTAPPKSTGREYFNINWLEHKMKKLAETIQPEDIQCTLLNLTAITIADTINQYKADEVIFCGGGYYNTHLITTISEQINSDILHADELGIKVDQVEAAAFAWLAKKCLKNESGILKSVTGAHSEVIAGAIYPG